MTPKVSKNDLRQIGLNYFTLHRYHTSQNQERQSQARQSPSCSSCGNFTQSVCSTRLEYISSSGQPDMPSHYQWSLRGSGPCVIIHSSENYVTMSNKSVPQNIWSVSVSTIACIRPRPRKKLKKKNCSLAVIHSNSPNVNSMKYMEDTNKALLITHI